MEKHARRHWAIITTTVVAIGLAFYCYNFILRTLPTVMVPELMTKFQIDAEGVGAVSAFFYFAYTLMQLPAGIMLDRFGIRKVLIMAICACIVGSFIFALSNSYHLAELARFMIGFGATFSFIGVLKISATYLPHRYFSILSGVTASIGLVGAMIGVVGLAHLVDAIGMTNAIFFTAGLGIILLLLIIFFIPERKPRHLENEFSIQLTLGEAIAALITMLKNKNMWIVGICGLGLFLPIGGFAVLWGVPFIETVCKVDKTTAALTVTFLFLGYAVGGPSMAAISNKLKQRKLPLIASSFIAAGMFCIALYVPNLSTDMMRLVLFIAGFFGSVQALTFAVAHEYNPGHLAATATSLTNMFITLGGTLFLPLFGFLLDWHHAGIHLGLHHAHIDVARLVFVPSDYDFALALIPIMLALAGVLACFLKESYKR